MIEKKGNISVPEAINRNIEQIDSSAHNTITGIFLDETLSELYGLENEVIIPSLPVKEIGDQGAISITNEVIRILPQYLKGHRFLEKRKPSSEQHSLHFIMPVKGITMDFVHILRLDFKFSGKTGEILTKGDTENYPSYKTDRISFKSRLVPVLKGSDPFEIESIRLKESVDVETDKRIFTSVIFDEYSNREISIELSRNTGADNFRIPVKIYPFIVYEYFTACLSIPDPEHSRIKEAAQLFEPVFLCLYYNYRTSGGGPGISESEKFKECLKIKEGKAVISAALQEEFKKFFSCYSLFSDEELMLKGLRKIIID